MNAAVIPGLAAGQQELAGMDKVEACPYCRRPFGQCIFTWMNCYGSWAPTLDGLGSDFLDNIVGDEQKEK